MYNISRKGTLNLDDLKSVDPQANPLRLQSGDVLFNNTNSPVLIGKTTAIMVDGDLGYSNHMTRLRLASGVETRFVAHQLHYLWMSGYFRYKCVKHVNQASISSTPLSETVPDHACHVFRGIFLCRPALRSLLPSTSANFQ